MAKKRVKMNKVREIVRLAEEMGLSNRKIGRVLRISHPVVSQYLSDMKACGLKYQDIKEMSDTQLVEILEKRKRKGPARYGSISEKFGSYVQELKKTGVNRLVLWEEYRKEYPDGYSYSQFCHHLQVWLNGGNVTMHLEHKAGDKAFIDFAGKKLSIVDFGTGELREVEILVAILGASQLTYVEAVESQKKED